MKTAHTEPCSDTLCFRRAAQTHSSQEEEERTDCGRTARRGKTRRSGEQELQVVLPSSAWWAGSGSVGLPRLIHHVKDVSGNVIFCRGLWHHPGISCPSHLPAAHGTVSVAVTPVRKAQKWVVFTDGLWLARKSQKSPQMDKQNPNKNQPSGNFKNDHMNWIRPPIYFLCLKTSLWGRLLNGAPFFEWKFGIMFLLIVSSGQTGCIWQPGQKV